MRVQKLFGFDGKGKSLKKPQPSMFCIAVGSSNEKCETRQNPQVRPALYDASEFHLFQKNASILQRINLQVTRAVPETSRAAYVIPRKVEARALSTSE